MDGGAPQIRRYLFLQGMATQFFAELGQALARRGHVVRRINFNAGDWLFWHQRGSVAYRGTPDEWPRALERYLNEWRITDIVLFGDWRPLHAPAIRIARLRGITIHVFEEGYIRPGWITLEQGGVNKNSSLPRDPAWFLDTARTLPPFPDATPVLGSFRSRAVQDVVYHVWRWLSAWRYPGYHTHLAVPPLVDYVFWIRRFMRASANRRRVAETLNAVIARGPSYFLVPLQLDSDSQLRLNSPFGHLAPAIDKIVGSFACHAPTDTLLLLKEHPLDNQRIDWRAQAMALAERLGIGGRVLYVAGGDISDLMQRSRGVVTINSTSGLLALSLGLPVATLARPIYSLPGLTFQGDLDRFWYEATPPNADLVDAFRRILVDRALIRGDFFSKEGIAKAVSGAVARFEADALGQGLARLSLQPYVADLVADDGAVAEAGGGD